MFSNIEESIIQEQKSAHVKMFKTVTRLKEDIEQLYDEFEILLDKELMKKLKIGLKEEQMGELHDWDDFKKIIDENV